MENALEVIRRYGSIDGEHHKTWVIDQVVRALLGCKSGSEYESIQYVKNAAYEEFVIEQKSGENGPDTYDWDDGIAP